MPLFQNPAAGHSAQEGEKPDGAGEADEQAARKAAEWKNVFFADPGKALLSADGVSPRNELMKDVVHPNAKGYEVLEKELAVLLKKLDAKYRGGKSAGKHS